MINIQTNYNQKIKIPNILLGIFRLKTTLKEKIKAEAIKLNFIKKTTKAVLPI